jgi:hypothetical protein
VLTVNIHRDAVNGIEFHPWI